MSKIKAAWNWLKEKWWIPLTATVVVLVSVFFRPRANSLNDLMRKDMRLSNKTNKQISNLQEQTHNEAENVRQQTSSQVEQIRTSKEEGLKQIDKNKQELSDALSKHTNRELAEMLRKEDEV